MASFQIHEDQENIGREIRNKKNVAAFGANKRQILKAVDDNQERTFREKQPLGISNKNSLNKENACVNQAQLSKCAAKLPAPVVPVAQFQAFKVYEDNCPEKINRSIPKYQKKRIEEIFRNVYKGDESDRLVTKKEVLEKAGVIDMSPLKGISIDSPMSIEKPEKEEKKNIATEIAIPNRTKDLFFELDEYRDDIYQYLLEKEKLHRPKPNYMRKQPDITNDMRTILVDWLVEVAEEYKLQTETLYLAVNFIDRFLSFMSVVRAKLQLVGTSAMYIAAKYEEVYAPDVSEFVYITDDTYSKRQVLRMELLILKVLNLDLSVPTAYTFILAMSIPNKLSDKVIFLAQYLSELALLQAEPTLEIPPSVIAASSIAVALHTLGEPAWNQQLEESTAYKLPELQRSIEFIQSMHSKASTLPQQAIQDKYKTGKYLHVSTISPREHIKFD